jgi:hypothetical protein
VVLSDVVTSDQVAPPSLLTWTFSPLPNAPCVPETVSVVSLVLKSLDELPVSWRIAVIATAAVGTVLSTVIAARLVALLTLPAMSVCCTSTALAA